MDPNSQQEQNNNQDNNPEPNVVSSNPSPAPTESPAPQVFSPANSEPANPPVEPSPAPESPVAQSQDSVSEPAVSPVYASVNTAAPANTGAIADDEYTSNPFLNTVKGLVILFKTNAVSILLSGLYCLVIYILLIILMVLIGVANPVIGVIAGLLITIVGGTALFGMFCVIAAKSVIGESISAGKALGLAISRVIPLFILGLLSFIMLTIGFILLIIPGIYLMGRLALAPFVMFAENLGPIASIKRSFELTSGHVLEVLGSNFAGAIMSGGGFGLLFPALTAAPLVGRYQELKALKESGAPKPKLHWLNIFLPLVLIVFVGLYIGLIAFSISQGSKGNSDYSQPFNSPTSQPIETDIPTQETTPTYTFPQE